MRELGSGSFRPLYDPTAVEPMRQELKGVGVEELTTPEAVDEVFGPKSGTVLLVVNSVCGCAAGNARPGVMLALQNKKIPDKLTTVFAGQDREATDKARSYIEGFPPSSPSIALFKDGQVVTILERHRIEGRSPQEIAVDLIQGFNDHCDREGPSVSPEEFAKVVPQHICGNSIPKFDG